MITQSLHFEITGQDAQRLSVCQERNIEPMVALESFLKDFTKSHQNKADAELRAKKLAYAGVLSHLANPKLMALEEQAVEMAIRKKHQFNQQSL